jgi:DNA-binding NarL/FixJ family response regulator
MPDQTPKSHKRYKSILESGDDLRILVVDDNPVFLGSLCKYLQEISGFTTVETAQGGGEALKTAADFRPDIFIIDMEMPNINGIEAAQRLRAVQPEILIIMISVQNMEAYREAALEAGVDEFISKSDISRQIAPAIERLSGAKKELNAA